MWDSDMWYVRVLLDLCKLQIGCHDGHIARTYLLSLEQWLTARLFHPWYPWGDISRWYIVLSIRTIHERDSLLRQDDRHLCWGARGGSLAGSWSISNTNMLRGMFCFGVKCEWVYSPLEEDMHCALHCAAHDPVSHRHAVEGEFKRQLRGLLYRVYVRPRDCAVCRMVVGCVYPPLFSNIEWRTKASSFHLFNSESFFLSNKHVYPRHHDTVNHSLYGIS
jgi:hypothetical protein